MRRGGLGLGRVARLGGVVAGEGERELLPGEASWRGQGRCAANNKTREQAEAADEMEARQRPRLVRARDPRRCRAPALVHPCRDARAAGGRGGARLRRARSDEVRVDGADPLASRSIE